MLNGVEAFLNVATIHCACALKCPPPRNEQLVSQILVCPWGILACRVEVENSNLRLARQRAARAETFSERSTVQSGGVEWSGWVEAEKAQGAVQRTSSNNWS